MKKLLTFIIAAAFAATAMTACTNKETNLDEEVNTEVELPAEEETEGETEESTETPETETEETEEPDVTVPETEETEEPEAETPEVTVPETNDPVEVAPEVTVPEEAEPEVVEPEVVVPETEVPEVTVPEAGADIDVTTSTLDKVIEGITAIEAPEFMCGMIPVDTADVDSLSYFTGLKSADNVKEVAVHEAMMGSQAYSMVLVRVNDAANAKAVAEEMKSGIDTRKWICVEADDLKVSAKGDLVMLIMVDSEYASVLTAASVTEAFKTVCGGSLDFEL